MTNETLQQKIDAVFEEFDFHEDNTECNAKYKANKALQEFREQINDLKFGNGNYGVDSGYRIGYDTACINILALLGEKK